MYFPGFRNQLLRNFNIRISLPNILKILMEILFKIYFRYIFLRVVRNKYLYRNSNTNGAFFFILICTFGYKNFRG